MVEGVDRVVATRIMVVIVINVVVVVIVVVIGVVVGAEGSNNSTQRNSCLGNSNFFKIPPFSFIFPSMHHRHS